MTNPGGKMVQVAHVVEALEQMEGVVNRLLIVFRAMDPDTLLAMTRAPVQTRQVRFMSGAGGGTVEPVPEIEPLPLLKDNCS